MKRHTRSRGRFSEMGCGASQPRPEVHASYEAAVEQEPRTGVLLARKPGEAISGAALEADTSSRKVAAAAAGPSDLAGARQPQGERLAPVSRRRSSLDDSAIDIERRSSGVEGLSEMVRQSRRRRSSSWGGGDVRCARAEPQEVPNNHCLLMAHAANSCAMPRAHAACSFALCTGAWQLVGVWRASRRVLFEQEEPDEKAASGLADKAPETVGLRRSRHRRLRAGRCRR